MRRSVGTRSFMPAARLCALSLLVVPVLAGCGAGSFLNDDTKFSSSEYGVAASPRVTRSKDVPKGGGRYMVGKPYKVAGRWFHPQEDPNYDSTGEASWYGPNFHGRRTANGEVFDQFGVSAAHPTLPLPSYVRVTNLANNRSLMVRVNDRGPFVRGREIDLSARAAELLDYRGRGKTRVRVRYVGKAPLEGDDTKMLVASLNKPTRYEQHTQAETRVAMAENAPAPRSAPPQPVEPQAAPDRAGTVSVNAQGFNIVNSGPGAGSNGGLGPLFYAPEGFDSQQAEHTIDSAFAAAEAMATRANELDGWKQRIDADARDLKIGLGVFARQENAQRVVESFAMIAAVDEDAVTIGGRDATRLTLSQLKPGATRRDVTERIQQLGLKDVILY